MSIRAVGACVFRKGKERKGKERKGKARQGKARQGKARQGKARQGKARQGKARQGKARQGKARQSMHTQATPNHLVRKYYFTIPILPKVKILLYHSYPARSQKMMTE
jgi:hypothetical protein